MARALALAEQGLYTTTPNPRVGCVIVRGTKIMGEGWHQRAGGLHAEAAALDDALSKGHDVRGATLYVTLAPCDRHGRVPPCVDAVINAGIGRVVAAMDDPNPAQVNGIARLRSAGIEADIGLLERDATELNIGFVSRMQRGVPWVRSKIAASLDGRTALSNGDSRWITSAAARADGHAWRARACAIVTGIGTVLRDDPALTVRDVATPRQPLRVIVDRNADTPADARVLQGGDVVIVTAGARNERWRGVETLPLPDADGRVDLTALMRELARRGINEVHVEAGAKLNGALLRAGLVDELVVYVAPSVFGDPARGMFELAEPIESLAGRVDAYTRALPRDFARNNLPDGDDDAGEHQRTTTSGRAALHTRATIR
ncbi:MAG TPA: bifunctional diaminohydroxyphosphoribosylaminopyrimidine deaminase/5-amino-6-(5-phosphoribosylamino)uracil reductase RibD, partial [Casimicrobiaceae bacterium]|nr:bifunctional diaminohydroxyphosphoribosylaminopyrimidine deaminase/5-amino-6-(5-phosphoribosylamino)uracil reductase RibD [Casimicrobiaceae bacterium]